MKKDNDELWELIEKAMIVATAIIVVSYFTLVAYFFINY